MGPDRSCQVLAGLCWFLQVLMGLDGSRQLLECPLDVIINWQLYVLSDVLFVGVGGSQRV